MATQQAKLLPTICQRHFQAHASHPDGTTSRYRCAAIHKNLKRCGGKPSLITRHTYSAQDVHCQILAVYTTYRVPLLAPLSLAKKERKFLLHYEAVCVVWVPQPANLGLAKPIVARVSNRVVQAIPEEGWQQEGHLCKYWEWKLQVLCNPEDGL